MLRGEIWFGVWPNDPHKKKRPLLIVSNNYRNQAVNMPDVTVVKLTSLERADRSKKMMNPAEDLVCLLKKQTIIRCGAIFTVEKSCLVEKASHHLTPELLMQVDAKLKVVLDLY